MRAGVAVSFDVKVTVDIRNVFDVLANSEELVYGLADAARDIVGGDNVYLN